MSLFELFRAAATALQAHRLRSLLTTLGVVIAVWTIVSVLSVIQGMSRFVEDQVFSLSPDVFVVTKFGIITSTEEFFQAIKRKDISDREIERLRELCHSCGEIGASLTGQSAVHNGSRRMADVPVNGTSANFAALQGLDIEIGRFLSAREEAGGAPVAVIGYEIKDELFPGRDPLNRRIWIDGIPHRVIGLLTKRGNLLGQNLDLAVYIPKRKAAQLYGHQQGNLNVQVSVLVRARDGIDAVPACQEEVLQVFRWLRNIPFRGPDPVGFVTAESVANTFNAITLAIRVLVLAIASVSLVVGAIVVANIMLVSVVERTREIGLRLALGAHKRDIRRQFLIEAIILALFGGAIGSAIGTGTAALVDAYAPVPAEVAPSLILFALAVATVAGVVAGFFPAKKAANLVPIDALRHE